MKAGVRRVPAEPDRLAEYRAKRDFTVTSEPEGVTPGGAGESTGGRFVVQRHRAGRLHYDLRLELGGVLVSWAVPRGPTLDPGARRLAVRVEDHPLDYFSFEGVIPAGSYGAGDVIVWDRGTWTSPSDAHEALAAGELHVDLDGVKLAGRFVLRRDRRTDRDNGQRWILVHRADAAARPGWDAEDHPRSVRTGLRNPDVAAHPELVADAAARPRARWSPATAAELAALDDLGDGGVWRFDGVDVPLANLDKVLFGPRAGSRATPAGPAVTKRDLVRYHAVCAPLELPYLVDRPVLLRRFPDGADGEGFWSKALPRGAPDWVGRWDDHAAREGRTRTHVVVDRPATLVWLANLAALEIHPWNATVSAPGRPRWAYVDIDPGPANDFADVLTLARLFRTALDHLGVIAASKVTGSRGVHMWIPVASGYEFADTRDWVERVSRAVGAVVPDLVSWRWRTDERGGLARLDYTQNASNRTLVAPFSPRARPGAPVSMPIEWEELDDDDLAPDSWTIHDVTARVVEHGDPLVGLIGLAQHLPDLDDEPATREPS